MPIPDEKIEEIRAAADVVDVVGEYVRLKKSGSGYKGLCPFHNEKTPSFHVDPDKNLFYCFGCQKGGDVFSFLQEVEGLSFVETTRLLAERAGIPLPEDEVDTEAAGEAESIYHALRFAARFFYRQLTQEERGRPALDYLRGRGIQPQTIKTFGLGYAPDAWDALLKAAAAKQIAPETMEKAGLVVARNDGSGYYDRYRGRIIFPIFSHVGKVLGFGGRILNDDSDQPKYINSPETKVYNKSKVLYGLRQAKQGIREANFVGLVEGYTDVISLHQAGVDNVVAASGTALTAEQVKILKRYSDKICLIYDSDAAGARATLSGCEKALGKGLTVFVADLPMGEDPDTFVRSKGGKEFSEYVKANWKNLPAFRIALAIEDGSYEEIGGRSKVMRSIMETISLVPDPITREDYVHEIADATGIADIHLFEILEECLGDRQRERRLRKRREQRKDGAGEKRSPGVAKRGAPGDTSEPVSQAGGALPEEKVLIRLMLEHGTPMVEFILGNMALDEFSDGPVRRLVDAFVEMYEADAVDPQRALDGRLGADVQNLAAAVMMNEYEPSKNWMQREITVPRLNEKPYEAAASAMTLLKLDRVNEAIDAHRQKIYRADRDGDEETLRKLQNQMMALHELGKRIERREFLEGSD